ncbi:hypothetical protein BC833DRAFT_528681 [Globomyces pollinis-pini]|nr:hypothetical protein BC833DRAFT_528681 [Globomyces pollinis-pini]
MVYAAGGYFAIINVASIGLFWYDKHQATSRGWRVPEKQLQFSALLGGWIGGLWAMKQFKHKTVKQEFRTPYFICTGINIAAIVGLGAAMASPASRNRIQSLVKTQLKM